MGCTLLLFSGSSEAVRSQQIHQKSRPRKLLEDCKWKVKYHKSRKKNWITDCVPLVLMYGEIIGETAGFCKVQDMSEVILKPKVTCRNRKQVWKLKDEFFVDIFSSMYMCTKPVCSCPDLNATAFVHQKFFLPKYISARLQTPGWVVTVKPWDSGYLPVCTLSLGAQAGFWFLWPQKIILVKDKRILHNSCTNLKQSFCFVLESMRQLDLRCNNLRDQMVHTFYKKLELSEHLCFLDAIGPVVCTPIRCVSSLLYPIVFVEPQAADVRPEERPIFINHHNLWETGVDMSLILLISVKIYKCRIFEFDSSKTRRLFGVDCDLRIWWFFFCGMLPWLGSFTFFWWKGLHLGKTQPQTTRHGSRKQKKSTKTVREKIYGDTFMFAWRTGWMGWVCALHWYRAERQTARDNPNDLKPD